jgi:hypothetical protein
MNYLTNYYKNLCEQLQEKVNMLEAQLQEAEIYSPSQMTGKRGSLAGIKRERMASKLLSKLAASKDESEKESITRVLADMMKFDNPSPGSEKVAKASAQAKESSQAYKHVYGTSFPEEGHADVSDIRAALKASKKSS